MLMLLFKLAFLSNLESPSSYGLMDLDNDNTMHVCVYHLHIFSMFMFYVILDLITFYNYAYFDVWIIRLGLDVCECAYDPYLTLLWVFRIYIIIIGRLIVHEENVNWLSSKL